MGKMLKWILIGAGALVVVVAGVLFFALSQLDSIVKAVVEKVGSDVTGTKVTLNDVDISLKSGSGSLRGFTVQNPDGFKKDDAFAFDQVSVTLDIASVFPTVKDPIVVKDVTVVKPRIIYDISDKGSNFDKIKQNAESKTGAGKGSAPAQKSAPAAKDEKPAPKIIIEKLTMTDGSVAVRHHLMADKKISAPLPNIQLKDIGKDKGGATPSEIAQRIFASVQEGASKAVSSIDLSGMLKDVGGLAKDATKAVGGAASGAADKAKSLGGGATDAVKGLFKQ